MRISVIAAATAALGLGLLAAPPAAASCKAICKVQYDLCISDGYPVSQCEAEREQCLIDCAGPAVAGTRQPFDRRVAKQCRVDDATSSPAAGAAAAVAPAAS